MSQRVMSQSISEEIGHLPAQILLSMARNDAALPAYRKAAVKLMLEKGYPQVNHPDLVSILNSIAQEQEAEHEVEAIVEAAIEEPLPTLKASVTTQSLYVPSRTEFRATEIPATLPPHSGETLIVRNPAVLNEDAL